MKSILFLSDFAIPLIIFYVVGTGLIVRCSVYDVFVQGAKKGLEVVVGILPTLVGLLVAVNVLRSSGFMEALSGWLVPIAQIIHIPEAIVPLVIVKMFSSSAATGVLIDLYQTYGPDSLIGTMASVICGSTETIFYTMSVYFMAANVQKTRWTLPGALIASISGVISSVFLTMF